MNRKLLGNQLLKSSMCLELSDREAEALQGGTQAVDKILVPKPSPEALVLLFANPFSA